jgi:phosphoglucosamine mutase
VVVDSDRPVSEVCRVFEPVPQIMENVRTERGAPLEDAKVIAAISDAEKRLGNKGRVLVRKSGTEPVVRIMAEGDDEAMVKDVVATVADAVRAVARPA